MSDASPSAITPASTAVPPAQLVCAPTVREWPGLSIPALDGGPRPRDQFFQHAGLLYDVRCFRSVRPLSAGEYGGLVIRRAFPGRVGHSRQTRTPGWPQLGPPLQPIDPLPTPRRNPLLSR